MPLFFFLFEDGINGANEQDWTLNKNPLDIRQRFAGELQDICCRANEDEQELGEFVSRNSAPKGKDPLAHDEEDEKDLMEGQDPVVGTNARVHLV